MVYTLTCAILAAVVLYSYNQARCYHRYIAEARRSGFQYFVAPVYFQSVPWMLLQNTLVPILRGLPSSWIETWLPLSLWYRIWHAGYKPFARAGQDTFIMTSSSGNVLWTCDPEVINQVLDRRQDFLKPSEVLQILNIYGPTFTASEGEEHMKYRKLAAPSFNERTHRTVWRESLKQSEDMAEAWRSSNGCNDHLDVDGSKIALHVLSKVFFNKDMQWTDVNDTEPPSGHKLTYQKAISDTFKHGAVLFTVPKFVLNISPIESHQRARLASLEYLKYMQEMRNDTEERLAQNAPVVRTGDGEGHCSSLLDNFVKAGMPDFNSPGTLLPSDAVYGNLFIFTLAGHETSANTFAIAIVLLACHPGFQKAMQNDIDTIFDISNQNSSGTVGVTNLMRDKYESTFPRLWRGHVGALMQETLRLWAPVPFIPKVTKRTQIITTDNGRRHVIAPNTLVLLNTAALHRNPKYWPPTLASSKDDTQSRGPREVSANDLLLSASTSFSQFHPERWLDDRTSDFRHSPPQGAYLPFSGGFRACFGSRFARIEFCATVARIFAEWSVELADQTFSGLKAAEQCLSEDMDFGLGLRMNRNVALRFVKRQR